jgi:ABC-type polysaccharide/polyol phosphate export permease
MQTGQNINLPSFRFAWYYAVSRLKLKYRYTVLGFTWNILEPAIYLVILSLIFSVINRMNINDYSVFLFSALVPWRYFEKVVNTIMESIVNGEWLIKKMYVSPFAFPLNQLIISSFELLFSMISAFILFIFLKDNWSVHIIILPLSIIPWALLASGIGLITAILYTFFRDVKPLVQLFLTLTFFTSPILFKPDIFQPGTIQQQLMQLHPFTYLSALFQKPVYQSAWPTMNEWIISFSLGLAALLTGVVLINKFKSRFYYHI